MYCLWCGAQIDDSASHCPKCGQSTWPEEKPLTTDEKMSPDPGLTNLGKSVSEGSPILMKCKACGGTLEADPDRPVLVCPYCGEKELVWESDAVKVERIRNNTHREIEMEKLRQEEEQFQHRSKVEAIESYKKSKQYIFTIVALIICIIFTLGAMSIFRIFCSLIGLAQCGCLIASILHGRQVITSEKPHRETLFLYIAIALVIPFMLFVNFL